jgi:hypothetical protein
MDTIELHHALGSAYTRAHVGADRHGAVAELRNRLGTESARRIAREHLTKLAETVRARTRGGRCGCIVTQTAHDLLSEALKGTADAS